MSHNSDEKFTEKSFLIIADLYPKLQDPGQTLLLQAQNATEVAFTQMVEKPLRNLLP